MELKIVKPKMNKREYDFLKMLESTKKQILLRAKQLENWGNLSPQILPSYKSSMLVEVGAKIQDLIKML